MEQVAVEVVVDSKTTSPAAAAEGTHTAPADSELASPSVSKITSDTAAHGGWYLNVWWVITAIGGAFWYFYVLPVKYQRNPGWFEPWNGTERAVVLSAHIWVIGVAFCCWMFNALMSPARYESSESLRKYREAHTWVGRIGLGLAVPARFDNC